MKRQQRNVLMVIVMVLALFIFSIAGSLWWRTSQPQSTVAAVGVERPVLSVVAISPRLISLPTTILASGYVTPWQEADIDCAIAGQTLVDVAVDVGDVVSRDQVVAKFETDTLQAELSQSMANVAEAEALLAQAQLDAARARVMAESQAMSAQQIQQYLTTEQTALARVKIANAAAIAKRAQLKHTVVRAPDDGVISARSATLGAVPPVGETLFRLIRQGRLEWRAEVAANDLHLLTKGQQATIKLQHGNTIRGHIRQISPVIDEQTFNALVYVDLPANQAIGAGIYLQGTFEIDTPHPVLALPQSAVLLRDGFSYVFTIAANARVTQTKVTLGRRAGAFVEVVDGVDQQSQIVAVGAVFLSDGDLVQVVDGAVTRIDVTGSGATL